MHNVLITGASGGIGADLARVFAARDHRLALVARNGAALESLADELGVTGGARPLCLSADLSKADAAAQLSQALQQAGFAPGILVNNAGYGLSGRAAGLDRANQLGILDLNIHALTDLTLTFLPAIRSARGRILNVASTAAFLPGPGMAVYYASKAYVLSFSQALAQEMAGSGVTVTALCPGPTATAFFDRAGGKTARLKAMGMMKSMDVARAGYDGAMAGKRVVVPGLMNKLIATSAPFMPRALLLPIIARIQMGKGG